MFIVSTVLQYDNNNNLLCNCYVPVIDDFLPCTVQYTQIRNQDVIKPKTTYKFTMELNYVLFSLLALGFIKYRGNRQKKEVNSILRIFQIKLFHYMGGGEEICFSWENLNVCAKHSPYSYCNAFGKVVGFFPRWSLRVRHR